MLDVEDLGLTYGPIRALTGVSLSVKENDVVAVLGSNGAGKSSLLGCVAGLLQPARGSISFEGRRIDGAKAHEVVRLGISLVPEGRRLFPSMTVGQHLTLSARASGRGKREDIEDVLGVFPVLRHRLNQRGGTLSGGEQQMLAIARALVTRPRLLLLDEPSMGLAPFLVQMLFEKLLEIRRLGATLCVVEQNVQQALRIADFVYVLRNGSVAAAGAPRDLASHDLVGMYLGESPSP